jgi:hypothetical protein
LVVAILSALLGVCLTYKYIMLSIQGVVNHFF